MCNHEKLEYLGGEKTDGGFNQYFKCLECGAVIVVTPGGTVFKIGGRKVEEAKILGMKIVL
ncbi:MAG: hypothetical protein DRN49_03560 [Thaumarchaeota archaeon]|nr:MAG: hypothetical protein DRN49_03560 [Nitrososphaerota archaeon]